MSEHSRWNYTKGSRPEGVIVYDDGAAVTSHHDTDPARGSHNSFDLCRLHLFGHLDKDCAADVEMSERPSFKAMVDFAGLQPEVQAVQVGADFEILPPLEQSSVSPVSTDVAQSKAGLARRIAETINNPTLPRWLIKDVVERGVLAIIAGPRGSYKSFLALDWAMTCALKGDPVYVLSAEGGDFDRRAKAWLIEHEHLGEVENIPLYVAEKRLNLSTKDGVELIRADCAHHGIAPVLFVIDTFSKTSGGLDENDNSAVKTFLGLLDNGLKRAYDATVLLVAHTGHSEQGRPRGASALGADTDAEYIMSRNAQDDSVSVSRQRFKSSPELPPLYYRPEVVELDYTDDDGQPITSLVLLPTDPPPGEMNKRGTPKKNPGKLLAVAREMLAEADTVPVTSLLDKFVATLPHDSSVRDRRRRTAQRALDSLITDKFLVLRDADTISLTRAERVEAESFTKGVE